jgi:hypothetical protein
MGDFGFGEYLGWEGSGVDEGLVRELEGVIRACGGVDEELCRALRHLYDVVVRMSFHGIVIVANDDYYYVTLTDCPQYLQCGRVLRLREYEPDLRMKDLLMTYRRELIGILPIILYKAKEELERKRNNTKQ